MLKTKRLILLLTVIMLFSIFVGSGCNTPYSATLYGNASSWIKKEFKEQPMINNSQDNIQSKERKFIVDNKEKFEEIFLEGISELDIDFNTEIIIVRAFEDIYIETIFLEDVFVENSVLTITYGHDLTEDVPSSRTPYQRWLVVKMDRVDVDNVVFIER